VTASNAYLQCKGIIIICMIFCSIWLRHTSKQQYNINNSLEEMKNRRNSLSDTKSTGFTA